MSEQFFGLDRNAKTRFDMPVPRRSVWRRLRVALRQAWWTFKLEMGW